VLAHRNPADAGPWAAVPEDAGLRWAREERRVQQPAEAAGKPARSEISVRAAEAGPKEAESGPWHDAPSVA
jgi:hypothetical protein